VCLFFRSVRHLLVMSMLSVSDCTKAKLSFDYELLILQAFIASFLCSCYIYVHCRGGLQNFDVCTN
jgi:hypothetical protein